MSVKRLQEGKALRVFFNSPPVLVRLDQVADRIVNANDFFVRADEILTAFVELQRAIHEFAVSLILWWLVQKRGK